MLQRSCRCDFSATRHEMTANEKTDVFSDLGGRNWGYHAQRRMVECWVDWGIIRCIVQSLGPLRINLLLTICVKGMIFHGFIR